MRTFIFASKKTGNNIYLETGFKINYISVQIKMYVVYKYI